MFPRPSGIITLTSDLGLADPAVGVMKGALACAASKPQVVDLSHGVPAGDVAAGAFALWSAIDRFPGGTVHCAAVGLTGGAELRLLAACAHGCYWLGPDSGVLASVLRRDGAAEARQLDLEHLGVAIGPVGAGGRVALASVAALLASGRYGFSALGPRAADAQSEDPVFGGSERVVHVDPYGNLVTNVEASRAAGCAVEVGDAVVATGQRWGEVSPGSLLAYRGSSGLLEVAARDDSAARRLGIGVGAPVRLQNA